MEKQRVSDECPEIRQWGTHLQKLPAEALVLMNLHTSIHYMNKKDSGFPPTLGHNAELFPGILVGCRFPEIQLQIDWTFGMSPAICIFSKDLIYSNAWEQLS